MTVDAYHPGSYPRALEGAEPRLKAREVIDGLGDLVPIQVAEGIVVPALERIGER